MSVQYWKEHAKDRAAKKGHKLGRFINWPPNRQGQSQTVVQRALAVCEHCEATASIDLARPVESRITGTILNKKCPYFYTKADLAAIDAAHPVQES